MPSPAPYLAVVRRGQTEVYRILKDYLERRGLVEVVWDRRVAERRVASQPPAAERRCRERRGPVREIPAALGFFIARRGGGPTARLFGADAASGSLG